MSACFWARLMVKVRGCLGGVMTPDEARFLERTGAMTAIRARYLS